MKVESPRATLILFVYNQDKTVAAAALSCLAQRCEPIEIIFSDDASTDQSWQILNQIARDYQGSHQLVLRRNEKNLGIGAHYNAAIAAARGALLITAAGDDLSVPQRVEQILKTWDDSGQSLDLISSHLIDLDHAGQLHGEIKVDDLSQWRSIDQWINKRPHIVGAAHAFTKRLHLEFGDFQDTLNYEDQIMALRACAKGSAAIVDAPLVHYRRGGLSSVAQDLTKESRAQWLRRRYGNQVALYQQIHHELTTLNRLDLWRKDFRRRYARSALIVADAKGESCQQRWQLMRQHGWFGLLAIPSVWWKMRRSLL